METYREFTIEPDGKRFQVRDMHGFHFGYFPTVEIAKFNIDGYWKFSK